ncbi:MAG: 4a-hydroxytetrahydrobiopterin dehydratase [Nitriliruptor sp.]|uniref:4a-hydroxytetrahydrobiopterin dehydratase n=1 Tax=Nitriliruptor sp. TaxID=2448056 RepID=UPI0034A09BA0
MSRLDGRAVDDALAELSGWERDGDAIVRELRFETFRDAIAFIVRVADVAEAADHHPELANVYSKVEVRLTSHDVGGITDRDVSLARAIDGVVAV